MIVKFAAAQVIEAKVAKQGGGLLKDAHRHSFDYDPRPGYLYVRSRAISSRINDNYDEFPAEEIREAYKTFVGKPVFVNHHNENHRRARGVIVDAALHEDNVPKTGEVDTWVEVLMEVDAVRFPKLAQAILAGEIDRTSMGCDVKASQCSVCGNWAETPLQYCAHIPAQKGLKVRRKTASGEPEDVLVYEKCVGLSFFENSLLVEEPADPTAYFLGVDDRGLQMAANKKVAARPISEAPPGWAGYERDKLKDAISNAEFYDKDKVTITIDGVTYEMSLQQALSFLHNAKKVAQTFTNTEYEDMVFFALVNGEVDVGDEVRAEAKNGQIYEGIINSIDGNKVINIRRNAQPHFENKVWTSELNSLTVIGSRKKAKKASEDVWTALPRFLESWIDLGTRVITDTGQTGTVIRDPNDPPGTASMGNYVQFDDGGGGKYNASQLRRLESRKKANGEVKVPGQVDTLRDDDCPVCGEHDSFDGDVCMVCQYKRPPEEFLDPDLEMAQQVDLRQDEDAVPEQMGMNTDPETGQPDLVAGDEDIDPGMVDENGMPIEGEEEILGEEELADEEGLPVDPEQEALEEAVPEEMQAPEDMEEDGNELPVDPEAEVSEEGLEEEVAEEPALDGAEDVAEEAEEGEIAGDDESDAPIDVNADPDSIEADDDVEEDFSAEFNVQPSQTPTEGVDSDEQSEDDDEDDFTKKKKSHKSGDIAMRPTLEILAKQQGQINAVSKALFELARAAGVENRPAFAALKTAEGDENPAQAEGWANPEGEGGATEAPDATSEETLGDVDNEDRAGGSPDTPEVKGTEGDPNETGSIDAPGYEARKKAELEDVEEIGDTSENDTAPDAKDDLEGGPSGTVLDEPLDLNETDVTEPVAGTENIGEGERGQAGSGRTETEVRVDNEQANNPEPAFDYDEGGWDKESASEGRTIAALRLARLRLQAGIEKGDDLEIGTKIAKSSMSNKDIQTEIQVLSKVVTAQAVNQKKATRRPRGLVPRSTAKVERTVPSFSAPQQKVAYAVSEDEFLFE